MANYVLSSITGKDGNNAGPKAKQDITKFLLNNNFKNLEFEFPKTNFDKMKFVMHDLSRLFKGKQIDSLIFQYPIYSLTLTKQVIRAIRKYTRAKLYFVIHDVESLREYPEKLSTEREIFNQTDGMIVHNQKMKDWLIAQNITVPMVNLEIFDYDNPQIMHENQSLHKTICFAGNLAKAGFIQKVSWKETKLFAFGPNFNDTVNPESVVYQGQFRPDELTDHLQQSFGLVWDGQSLDKCDGVFGEYMKYNNPHKASLYLSAGIPILTWNQAAIADFVLQNNVGIAVSSLEELDDVLSHISENEYDQMKKNAIEVGFKMRRGFYILNAVNKLSAF